MACGSMAAMAGARAAPRRWQRPGPRHGCCARGWRRPFSSSAPSPAARHGGSPRGPPRDFGRAGPPRPQPREAVFLPSAPPRPSPSSRWRRAPWRTATASAACHGGPPRAPPAGSARGHHGRARGGVQRRWYPAPAVPTTCSTPHPRTPASRAASAAGIHGQERFELSYLGRGGSKGWTGSRRFDVRRASRRLSVSDCLSEYLRIQIAPRLCSLGQSVQVLGQRHGAAVADERRPQPPPLHFVGSSNLHAVAEESILLHQTPSEVGSETLQYERETLQHEEGNGAASEAHRQHGHGKIEDLCLAAYGDLIFVSVSDRFYNAGWVPVLCWVESSTSEKKVKAPLLLVLHLFAHPGRC
ncbi:uncharacterized protein LOC120661277 isoform X3 [Panicum virgatum]|uniref:uncharacterized protein LOC120661277 isoform X3 n=1 Tax=Panicum virgatum TaxID=38727 RepID=UPI0019D4FE54|nr:uncharacterized protein LOC120661277 isoform X3 [Panicum virgatum]